MDKSHFSTHPSERLSEGPTIRLMIVDDHEILRHGLREVINSVKGFTVVAEANSFQDTLTQIKRTAIDMVFMDLALPDGNGIELVHVLRQGSAPPAIIVLSATLDDDVLLEAMLAGASGYLTKDVPAAEIARLLQGFQRGELVITSSIASRIINLLVEKYLMLELSHIASQRETGATTPPDHYKHDLDPIDPLQKREASPLSYLTPQEDRIFQLMRLGLSNKQIASQLAISRFTVGKHIQNILRKLGVTNRTQAAQVASSTTFEGVKNADLSKFRK